jgi:predicted Zn finger-like uncharacterized protein
MFTVCPKCTLTLAVTAEDLRTGQGYVRCGRCLNVFNALMALNEGPTDADAPATYSQADPASQSQVAKALSADQAKAAAPTGPELERPHLITEVSSDGAIENESSLAEGTGSYETIVLEGDAVSQTEEFAPQEEVDHEIAALTERLEAQAAANEEQQHDEESIEFLQAIPAPVEETRPQPRRWLAGSVALAVLLIVQLVNHWRDALASTASLGAPMTRLYAGLGIPLDPHWDLGAYDIRQQGAASDVSDNRLIRVRLSIANHAMRSQPVPLIRLTLLDRYGKRIAARDLSPPEYWPKGHPMPGFLAHDQRIDTEIAVSDPGADSASFELDVCLKNARGAERCASDLPVTTSAS